MSLFKACSTEPARARVRVVLMAALLTSLVGCSSVTQKPAGSDASTATAATAGAGSPWLALAPSALGCNVSVQQRLTVQPPGQSPKELDALLEIDAGVLRLAILNLGQMVGTLEWDGVQLNQNLSRWWPAQLKPELATLVDSAPEGQWSYEIKFDGYRIMARIDHDQVQLFTRNGHDWARKLPQRAEALTALGLESA